MGQILFSAIIPAAGSGSRSGQDVPKQFVELHGQPLLKYSIDAFASFDSCLEIILAIDPRWEAQARHAAGNVGRLRIVPGGATRQDSIRNGLAVVSPSASVVLVHDAARPGVDRSIIESVVIKAYEVGGAVPALRVVDTLKRTDNDLRITETISRADVFAAQTPQGFQSDILRRAYRQAEIDGIVATDDSALVERIGEPVMIVDGDEQNFKVTLPADFEKMSRILTERAAR